MADLKNGSTVGGNLIYHSGNSGTPETDWHANNMRLAGDLKFYGGDVYGTPQLTVGYSSKMLRVTGPHGSVEIGSPDTTWCRFQTTLPKFYFNHELHVEGEILAGTGHNKRVFHNGYHPNADKWTTPRTFTLTEDLEGTATIDGSENVSLSAKVKDNSHNHTRLTNVELLSFKSDSSDAASISTTITGTQTCMDFNIRDDTNDQFRWRYNYWNTPAGDVTVMSLVPQAGKDKADLTVLGNVIADEFQGTVAVAENASKLGEHAPEHYLAGMANSYKSFTVDGDADTYYPVLLPYRKSKLYGFDRFSISRHYSHPAPDTWYRATHRGGLTLTWDAAGDSGWGGNCKNFRIVEFDETYCNMVAGMRLSVHGMVVWLRGGGAEYRYSSPDGQLAGGPVVHLTDYTADDKTVYSPRTDISPRTDEIHRHWPVRDNGELYDYGSNRVYSAANKPTASDVGALAKTGKVSHGGRITFTGKGFESGLHFLPTNANDGFGIRSNNTDGNSGELEFYSTDDDTEPFVFRHYTAGFEGTGGNVEWARIDNRGVVEKGQPLSERYMAKTTKAKDIEGLPLDGSVPMSGNLWMTKGSNSKRGVYWGKTNTLAYIRQAAAEGQLEIGSDDNIFFKESDNDTVVGAISTNAGTLTMNGHVRSKHEMRATQYDFYASNNDTKQAGIEFNESNGCLEFVFP